MASPSFGGGPSPLQAIHSVLSLENHIENLERVQKAIITTHLTWGLLQELESGVRVCFRRKKHAMAASGEWWLIGRVVGSTVAVYWSLGKLATLIVLTGMPQFGAGFKGAKDLRRVFAFLHPIECAN